MFASFPNFAILGFTCGTCDAKLREDLHKPCCIGCQRLYLNKEPEKKKKRGNKNANSGHDHATAASQNSVVTTTPAAPNKANTELFNRYKAAKESHDRLMKTYPSVEEMPEAALAEYNLAVRVMKETDQSTNITNNEVASKPKTVTAAADKRGSKRRTIEVSTQPVARPSASAEEDRAIRQKRGNRSTKKLGSDEWYQYTLVDKKTFSKEQVYVCSICGHDRTYWLRELEPYCSVQEFTFLLRSRITSAEEAKRELKIGHHFDAPELLHPDRMNKINKLLTSVGVKPVNPKALTSTNPTSRTNFSVKIPTVGKAKANLSQTIRDNNAKFRNSMPKKS